MTRDPGDEDTNENENEPVEDVVPYELPFHFGGDPVEMD